MFYTVGSVATQCYKQAAKIGQCDFLCQSPKFSTEFVRLMGVLGVLEYIWGWKSTSREH